MLLHWITGCIQSSSMDACIFMQIRCPGSSRAGSLNFLVPDDKLQVGATVLMRLRNQTGSGYKYCRKWSVCIKWHWPVGVAVST